jgi:hypothetical protein
MRVKRVERERERRGEERNDVNMQQNSSEKAAKQ